MPADKIGCFFVEPLEFQRKREVIRARLPFTISEILFHGLSGRKSFRMTKMESGEETAESLVHR